MNYSNLRELLQSDSFGVAPCANRAFEGEKVRLLAIGSREGVIETIHTLHALRYAEAGAWSPLLPVPNSTDVMSVLTRQRAR